ncbi:MAG: RNase adapter RapZ [Clostridia bacterium]|nr:RNase adapter RapZ [Clostridia bacterium]
MRFIIVTGMSGAGKSQAIKFMEDLGFFCVDNLPPALLPKFAELCLHSDDAVEKVAVVVDIRGRAFFDDLFESLALLKENGYDYEILFLDASDEVLIKRFKETRRKPPLFIDGRIINSIREERSKLQKLKEKANNIIDTSNLIPRQLREEIVSIFIDEENFQALTISVMSFGFKYGIPLDADLVFDVRFLPNPFYIKELKQYTGRESKVREYVMKWPLTKKFLEKLQDLLDFLIPQYIKEGKNQLVICIGCTGGKHRSVIIADELYDALKKNKYSVTINHRDIPEE